MSLYELDSGFVRELDAEILAMIAEGVEGRDEARFSVLACREFTFQYHANPVYRRFCQERGVSPDDVTSWAQIPALPVSYFKEQVVSSIPLERAKLQYMSSGTSDPQYRTRVYRDERCTEMVYAANRAATRAYLFPDVDRMPILLFVPSPEAAPFMGMAVGLTVMRQSFGTEDSAYLIGPGGLDSHTLFRALFKAEETGRPLALIGATSGFVFLFNLLAQQNLRFRLPAGTRVADGGGYMGTFGECSREEYLAKCGEFLGVAPEYCVNTLGMAECGQNYLDNVLRARFLGRPAAVRCKPDLPWTRTLVVDPETGARLPKGERGWLCHYDLTNRAGVLGVLTDNLGYEVEGGFEIVGRAKGAAADLPPAHQAAMASLGLVTCSTVADQMLASRGTHCSTVADGMLAGEGTPCSTVADRMLAGQGNPCSAVADGMLENQCQAVAERMLAAGAPQFVVDLVTRKLKAGEKIHHPFPMRPEKPGSAAGEN